MIVTNFENERNNLYLNSGSGLFEDRADAWGLGLPSESALSWGVGVHDFDNDGLLDVFVANGHVYTQAEGRSSGPGYGQQDQLFVGTRVRGRGRFVERGAELGLTRREPSRGAAFGDLDNDGNVDIVVCHLNARPAIYENRSPEKHRSLTVSLEQRGRNPQAIGARVEVVVGAVKRIVEVKRQASFQSSHDVRVHVGLGEERTAGVIRVRWPDGRRETFVAPAGGGTLTLRKGQGQSP